mgnify:CR=1 FL=1
MLRRDLLTAAVATAGAATVWPARAAAPEPPPLEAYGRLPAISHVGLSPSGERLAFVASDGEGRKLFVRTVAGQPLAVMPLADKKLRDVYWGGDRFVVFTVTETRKFILDRPPIEVMAGFVLDLNDNSTKPVFGRATKSWDVIFRQYGVGEIEGRWYGYFTTFEQNKSLSMDFDFADYNPDLYRMDLETGETLLINRGGQNTSDWVLDGDKVAARMTYDPDNGAWRVNKGEVGPVLASGTAPLAEVGLVGLGRTRDTVLLSVYDEAGRDTAIEVSLADGKVTRPIQAGHDVLTLLQDRSTDLLIGYTIAGDDRRTVFFDPTRQAMFDKIGRAFAGKRPWVASASASLDRVVVYTDGGDDSGSYWLVDLKALKADPLGAEYPRVTPSKVGLSRRFPYVAGDGTKLDGVLLLPPGRTPANLPVVVLPHGGPAAHSGLGFDWEAQAYASRGYAVFQPNFRGSTGYGKAFRDAGFGEWGRKMQTDISDGLAALAVAGFVDPKRACIIGSSYGGYAALAGVTVQNGLYRCAVSFGGVADPVFMLESEMASMGGRNAAIRYWRAFLGAERPGWASELAAVSPMKLAARADAPVLLIHGRDDTVVLLEQSRRMERALKAAGKPVELVVLDGEDHWLSGEATRTAMLKASVGFVLKHNPPD